MSIEKAELKEQFYKGLDSDLDAQIQHTKYEICEYKGGKKALHNQAKNLMAIVNFIKKDLDEKKFDTMEPLQFAKYAIQKIQHCVDATTTASKHQENCELQAHGALNMLKQTRDKYAKVAQAERTKIENVESASDGDENDIRARPIGVRPSKTLKQQRTTKKTAKRTRKAKKKVTNG